MLDKAKYITVYRGQMVACNTLADLNALFDGATSAAQTKAAAPVGASTVKVKIPTTFYAARSRPVNSHLDVYLDGANAHKAKNITLACVYDHKLKKWGTPTVVSAHGLALAIDETKSMACHILGDSFHGRHRIDAATGPNVAVNYTEANFR